jgi:hypothetical protein
MTKSTTKVNYRNIYEQHHGAIPVDESGISYDIHHIDGDRTNNEPSNLKAVSLQEHMDIHMSQGDWGAAQSIYMRMNTTHEQRSAAATVFALARVADGTHPWVGPAYNRSKVENGTHQFLGGEIQRRVTAKRLAEGTHNFQLLSKEERRNIQLKRVEQGVHKFVGDTNPVYKQLADGTHNFLGDNHPMKRRSAMGAHHWSQPRECPHCGKIGKGSGMNTWHFDKCRSKPK